MFSVLLGMLIFQSELKAEKEWSDDQLLKFYKSAPLAEYEDVGHYVAGLRSKNKEVKYAATEYWWKYGAEVEEMLRIGDDDIQEAQFRANVHPTSDPRIREKTVREVVSLLETGLSANDPLLKHKSLEALCRLSGNYKRFIPYTRSGGSRGARDDFQYYGSHLLFLNFAKVKKELLEFAKSEDPELVAGALFSFPDENSDEKELLIKRLLIHEDKYMRAIGALTSGVKNVLKSYWALAPLLEDPDFNVSTTASTILYLELYQKGAKSIPIRSWSPAAQVVYIDQVGTKLKSDEIAFFCSSQDERVRSAIVEKLTHLSRYQDSGVSDLAPETIFRKFLNDPSPRIKAHAAIGVYYKEPADGEAILEQALKDKTPEIQMMIFKTAPDTPKWNALAVEAFEKGLIVYSPSYSIMALHGEDINEIFKSWISSPMEQRRYDAYVFFLDDRGNPPTEMVDQIAKDPSPRIAYIAFDCLSNGDPQRLKILKDYEMSLKSIDDVKRMLYGLGYDRKTDVEDYLKTKVESGPRELRYAARRSLRNLKKSSANPLVLSFR